MFAKKDLCMILRFAGRQRLEETVQLFSRDREDLGSCSVAHPRKNSQTCPQNIEVTRETFWKISTNSCHEVPNELSNLLESNRKSKYQCCVICRPWRIVLLKVAYYATSSARNFAKLCQNYARIPKLCSWFPKLCSQNVVDSVHGGPQ